MSLIPYAELRATLAAIVEPLGFSPDDAADVARLFSDASRDGVPSHGAHRVPRFVAQVRAGVVDPAARLERIGARGALERWDGHRAAGMLNAERAMARAIVLAREHGVGCVALRETNHWMRAGSYAWQAADAGMIGICWTNTLANLPPWGAERARVGNNPFALGVPGPHGAHVVVDTAMSQFSFGALESYRRRGEPLPVPGGFDASGALTTDAAAIEASGRALPIGYWKGSALAIALDAAAALLAKGRATHDIPTDPARESGLSQTFLALDPSLGTGAAALGIVSGIVRDLHGAAGDVRAPGERVLADRVRSLRDGVWVDDAIWTRVLALSAE